MAEFNLADILKQVVGQQDPNAPVYGLPGAPYSAPHLPQGDEFKFPASTAGGFSAGDLMIQPGQGQPPQAGGQPMSFDQLALQELMKGQQAPKEKTWSDTGKELMAPLAVGLLKSLVHPRYGGFLGGLREGINTGVNMWQHQRDQAVAAQQALQRNAAARAGVLAKMGSNQAMEGLKRAQMEQTGELTRERIGETHEQNLARQADAKARLEEKAENDKRISEDRRYSADERAQASREHNETMRALAEMRKGEGPVVKAIDLKTGLATNVSREDAKDATRYKPWSQQAEKDISVMNKADAALGGLSEAMNRMKGVPESSPMGKLWDYKVKYQMMGGKGLSDEKMNMMSWVDLVQQQLLGMAGSLSGSRASSVLMMVTNHLPKQQDSVATIRSKIKTMTLAMDLAKDAAGYGGKLIMDPAGLASAKQQMQLGQDASEAEYQQKFGEYLHEKHGEGTPTGTPTSVPSAAPAATDPYRNVDWDALDKKYSK